MIEWFGKQTELAKSDKTPFELWSGMNGQIQFLIHTNSENKILHTVLVERNGVLEALTRGTPLATKWGGDFWGPRAYADFIEPLPATQPILTQPTSTKTQAAAAAGIPPVPTTAPGGKSFAESIADLPPKAARGTPSSRRSCVATSPTSFAPLSLSASTTPRPTKSCPITSPSAATPISSACR
jgi:hypothetical protein